MTARVEASFRARRSRVLRASSVPPALSVSSAPLAPCCSPLHCTRTTFPYHRCTIDLASTPSVSVLTARVLEASFRQGEERGRWRFRRRVTGGRGGNGTSEAPHGWHGTRARAHLVPTRRALHVPPRLCKQVPTHPMPRREQKGNARLVVFWGVPSASCSVGYLSSHTRSFLPSFHLSPTDRPSTQK